MSENPDDFFQEHGETISTGSNNGNTSKDRENREQDTTTQTLILDRKTPLRSAAMFVAAHFLKQEKRTLHFHECLFYAWCGTRYCETSEADIRAKVYSFLDTAVCARARGEAAPFSPNRTTVTDVIDALKAVTNLSNAIHAPAWLDTPPGVSADEVIACANGLLQLGSLKLLPSTPEFFGLNALDFSFDAHASAPKVWLRFLEELWPNDAQAIDTLQEIFGYFLTTDTRQQKVFLVIGPKRSGKGTMARVLRRLLGADNVVNPTLDGLARNFGLAPLIGKPLAIISDARIGDRADHHAIAERLLSISGEDSVTADRKYLSAWTGRLPTRFLILSNELPVVSDASGALASRFIVLTLKNSFFGKEDLGLTDQIVVELPGILNWAICGWKRLMERGHFVQPGSSAEMIQAMEDLGSPIKAFLCDECEIQPGLTVLVDTLFNAWSRWCGQQGRGSGTVQVFGRDLRAALPELTMSNPREGSDRRRTYRGLGLKRTA